MGQQRHPHLMLVLLERAVQLRIEGKSGNVLLTVMVSFWRLRGWSGVLCGHESEIPTTGERASEGIAVLALYPSSFSTSVIDRGEVVVVVVVVLPLSSSSFFVCGAVSFIDPPLLHYQFASKVSQINFDLINFIFWKNHSFRCVYSFIS